MKKYFYIFSTVLLTVFFYTTSSWNSLNAQGTTCVSSTPFCTDSGLTYPAGTNNGDAPIGPNYGDLGTTPNPAWLFMRVDDPGTINLRLSSTPSRDIDFAVWGPFESCTTPSEACAIIFAGGLAPSSDSYASATTEFPDLNNGQTGEIFIMLVTNFSNSPADLSITKIGGFGSTDCSIIFVDDCPVDLGEDINVCSTETLPLLEVTCPNPSPNYRFEWFVDDVSQGAPSTVSTFDPNHVPQIDPVTYKVVVTELSSPCPVGEDEIDVTIKPELEKDLIVFPNDTTICFGSDITFRVVASQLDIEYQLLVDGTLFGTAVTGTDATIELPLTGLPAGISTIQVQASYADESFCTVLLDEEAEITVRDELIKDLTVFPNDSTLCSASGAFVRIVDSQLDINYQILDDGVAFGSPVTGTGATIELPLTGLPVGISTIQVEASYSDEPFCTVLLDEQAELDVLGDITIDLGEDRVICENTSVDLDGTDTSHPANATYQWRRSTDGGTTYTDIPLATNVTFTASEILPVPQTPFEVFYKLEMRIPSSSCVYEDEIKITFEPLPITTITVETDSICNTGEGTIRIVNPEIGTRYTYQLYENNAGVVGAPIGTAESSLTGDPIIFTTPTISTTTQYFVIVRNTLTEGDCEITLDAVPEIIVHPLPTAEFSGGTNLCQGEDVELIVTMSGTQPFTLTYQRDSEPEVTVTGINADTYSFTTSEAGVYTITNVQDAFCENSDNPITTTVNVNPNPSFTLGDDLEVCDGAIILEAESVVDFDNPSYKWFRDGTELTGEISATLTTTVGSVGLVATTYEYRLEVTNNETSNTTNCLSSDVILVTFYPIPEAEISFAGATFTDPLQFCDSDGGQVISGVTPDHASFPNITYEWIDLGTGLVVSTDPAFTANNFSTTTNYQLTVSNGETTSCSNVATATIQFIENPVAEISHDGTAVPNGGSLDFCFDEGAQVLDGVHPSHAGLNITYEWTDITNGVLLGTDPQVSVSSPTNTFSSIDYQLIVKDESNPVFCESLATMTINFYPNPEAEISFDGNIETGNSLQFCNSDGTQTLNGVTPDHASFAGITYEWKDVATGTVVGTAPTLDISNFGATTTYELSVTNGITPSCERTAQITIQFIENPVAEISHNGVAVPNGGSLDFCFDEGAQVLDGVHPSHAGLNITYEWTDITNGVLLGTDPQVSVSNPTNTFSSIDYQLIVKDESNPVFCESLATMTINFYPNPEAEISFDGNIETGNSLQFCNSDGTQTLNGVTPDHASFPGITYEWKDIATGTVVGTAPTLDVSNFGATTTYELSVTNGITPSCERTAQITIQFIENPVAEISHDGTAVPNGGSLDFCFDEGAQILSGVHPSHAGLNITYEWTNLTTGVFAGNTAQISVTSPSNTTQAVDYQLVVNDESNPVFCESTTIITINFLANPIAEIQFDGTTAPDNLAFCDSEGARTLEGALPSHLDFGSVSYVWTQVGVGVVSNTSTLVTPASNFSSSETYILEVISNDNPNLCSRTDEITIEFFPSPDTEIKFEGAVVTDLGFCTSEGEQTISAPASPFYTYQWFVSSAADPTLIPLGTEQSQVVNNFALQGGETNTAIYTVIVTDTRATCPAQSSVNVSFYAEPETDESTLVVSASPITHCLTGTSDIIVTNAEEGVEYQLFREGVAITGAIQTPTVDLATITFTGLPESTTLTTGEDRFTYSVQATRIGDFGRRCTQMLADTATVTVYPEPTATVSGTATVCADSPTDVVFTITGNFPATLTYQVTDTFGIVRVETEIVGAVGSPSPQTFIINTNTNTYKPLSITDKNCSGTVTTDEVTITTVHPPKVNWVESNTAFCIDEAATFEVAGGINHQYFINGLPVSTSNPYIIQPNTLEAGTYEIYAKGFATSNGCSANSEVITFVVHPLPVVDLGVDRIKCVDDVVPLVATLDGSFIYDWRSIKDDGDIVTVGNGNDSLYVSLQGTYFVIVTNLETGCSDSSNIVSVTNYDTLDVDLGEDVFVCNPSSLPYRLVGSDISHQNGTTYEWYKENDPAIIGTDSVYDATEEGIYTVTAIDPRGCEARDTIRVNFTADPDFQILGHENYACGSQDTLRIEATNLRNMLIDWEGNGIVSLSDSNRRAIVDVSGIYTVTVTDTSTIANCSITKSVEVFVRPAIEFPLLNSATTDTTTLCQGDSLTLDAFDPTHDDDYQYVWTWLESNQAVATTPKVKITYETTESFASQRFEIKVTDPDGGCFSTDTVNVRFRRKPIARINASDSVICINESIVLEGGESSGNRFEWIKLPETTSFATTTNVTVTPQEVGEHTYVLKTYFNSSTECGGVSDTVKIRVNRKAIASVEEEEILLCENENLEINGFLPDNPAFTKYIWTHEENNTLLSRDSVLNISFEDIQPVSYEPFHIVLTVYDSLTGCDSTDRVLVKFNRASDIKIDSTYKEEVCIGDFVELTARGATSYLWSTGETTQTITVQLDTTGFHIFTVTGGYLNECQNTGDTAIVFVNPLPTIRAHSVDTVSICADDSITLYPSGGKNYVWLNDPTAFDTITVSPKVPTDYIVMGTDSNGCQNVDTVHVYVSPTFELPELLQVCENESVMIGDTLNFLDSATEARATYFWTPTGDVTPFINVAESGTYSVEVKIDDCVFTRQTEVQIKEKPVLELVSDTTLCFELGEEDRFERGQTHILRSNLLNRDSTITYLYVWTDSTGQFLGNEDSLEIEEGGNYRLRVIARYTTECETNDSTFVTELCQPRLFIPEAFTPNSDNLNDNFEVFGKHVKNFEMQIFNRWSEVIYEVRADDISDLEPQDFWDGTHKGKNVPTGAYIWIIRYTDPFSGSTKQIQKTGSFMIVR
ncbi:gliding motility-associated C-terminal domain-containing protein [Bernardetia sp. ABR2-2B]|uniref:T9SS type B sorting domain-containing protein n=1 Tax=Bernardetia sp. ABR2-2B TaxID=3127472 RepID=UPI0030D2CD08